ncbi:Pyruvate kinase [Papilio xuthus]|uniref:Pyruvate kinase n=1 Tax=Papilio xuthus TaxID=66420 RepID=A0A194PDF2_PAPXU|nr:Pyruvate kinase [Papilio xuthus]
MVWPTEFDTRLGEYDAMELPGQQLSAATAYSPLDHVLNLDIKLPAACQRLTGIIATVGKASNDVETMQRMMAAGMNIALLNLSFGTRDDHIDTIKNLRQAAKNYSVVVGKNFPLGIAARLPGRKIRTGYISDTYVEPVELISGETVRLTTDETYKDRCSSSIVYIDFLHFAEQLKKGDIILLDNETIQLKVEIISTTTLTCKIERGGMLGSNKDVFVPNVVLKMPTYSEKDKVYIDMAVHHQLDILVASFVDSKDSILELRNAMGEKGKKISIVANIQTLEGYYNFDEILEVANGVMITRQELGSDISPKKLVIAQKNMIARANKANVPVCLCAHLLSSMRFNKIPLRAELLDVANCILDGADALVLSAETAIGICPVDTISCMASACKEAEACVWTKNIFQDYVEKTPMPCDQATAIAMSAVLASYRSLAAAIVVVTTSGTSAFQVAKYRPRCPIIAVTRYAALARQMHLFRGVMPLIYEYTPDSDWQVHLEQRINFCTKWAMQRGFVRVGDPIVIVCGWKQGSDFTNTMRIVYATADINVT